MENTKIANLVAKLRALAARGDAGERELAEQKLNEVLKKYNITEESLALESFHDFQYKEEWERKLISQVGYKVLDNPDTYTRKRNGRTLKRVVFKCTEAQAIEIEYLYAFYKELYKKDVADFFSAFVVKHQLFGESGEGTEISEEELLKMMRYQSAMRNGTPYKSIESK